MTQARQLSKKTGRRPADAGTDQLSTRQTILNSAEKLFSLRGYYGVTVREIAAEAAVNVALITYYFGSKLELFNEVIERRAEEHAAAMLASLSAAVDSAPRGRPSVEALVRAFARPVLARLAGADEGWRHYVHLLAYLSNSQQRADFLQPMHRYYDPVQVRFIDLLHDALPHATRRNICWSFYMVMGALVHFYSQSEAINILSGGLCDVHDSEALLDHLAPFFAAGFYRMAEQDQNRE